MVVAEKRLIDEYFKVEDIDQAGQSFKRVSRIKCKSKSGEVDMELDVNIDIYPIDKGSEYRVLIVRSLGISQEMDQGKYKPEFSQIDNELLEKFQYAMFGRVFKMIKDQNKMINVFASFGGLILKLSGKSEELDKFADDQRVYLLMRKA
ncbi:unnamed protein product (macronuclear) [Paramecium tetraurelia]|uniref:DNA-directed RNA polymerases I, II, and III subunit RPABC3 n=2 Tax=Paramecium TaxID=5884 RepID=A0DFX5_PARTE|nr:uncharacterized protein GSPATT00002070001 [Paramecium tetraurelia]CAD8141466.1 unnamed protein product [Paramecium octaurelia]CAK81942.1 unnamed protein product [Paramecium tetraurelia]|eukprot:XP_001449339.1 hypothetical protein (macronuclear) [Paramecium tetraurelia strain d4-2]